MSLRLGARLVAALLPAALLLPAAAHAEKVVTKDAVGDSSLVEVRDSETGTDDDVVLTPAPEETATDIVRTVVALGRPRLRITVHLRDLVVSSDTETYVRVATPRGEYNVSISKAPGSRADASLRRKRGSEVECRGLRAALDGAEDTVDLSVPTRCIGGPRWVQVGVGVVRSAAPPAGTPTPTEPMLFADDGHRDGDIRADDVAKGPKVRRG